MFCVRLFLPRYLEHAPLVARDVFLAHVPLPARALAVPIPIVPVHLDTFPCMTNMHRGRGAPLWYLSFHVL